MKRRKASKIILSGTGSLLLPHIYKTSQALKMLKRPIPKSNEELPIVGLGTWQTFDVGRSEEQRSPLKEVLNVLIENGGSVIDSSPMYGQSEKVVGELVEELSLKNQIFEATKVWTKGEKEGQTQISESMHLMKANPLDLLQIHNLLDWKTHIKTLRRLKEEGTIRYLGITHYNAGGYAEMERIIKNEPLDFIQINYNLAIRNASNRILPLAKENGVAVLINRPYEGGALFRKAKDKVLPEWAQEFDAASWGQFFLKFILANQAVTCVIPGTSKPKHMKDNVRAGFGKMPEDLHLKKMISLIEGF